MKTFRRLNFGASRRIHGVSLVELLVAIAVGMMIVTAMSILFANNSRSRAETERASHKIENGRFALDLIGTELKHAGYYGVLDPRLLTLPTAKPDACITTSTMAALKAAMPVHVQGYDNVAASVLTCLTGANAPKPGTDIIVVRRVAGCSFASPATAGCTGHSTGQPVFQASSCATELSAAVDDQYKFDTVPANLTLKARNCTSEAPKHRYLVRIYYVASNDKTSPADGIPTLKRAELGDGAFAITSLVQGVENLQVEYGMDTDGNGSADVYSASPDTYLSCNAGTTPTCVGHWASVVSAKLFLLSRNVDRTPGYTDTKSYVLGRVADPVAGSGAEYTIAAANDGYKRSVFQEVVRLNNAAARRSSP